MSDYLKFLNEQTLMFDRIATLAIGYEESPNPRMVSRRIEAALVEWMDAKMSNGALHEPSKIQGISTTGDVTSITLLVESSYDYMIQRHRDIEKDMMKCIRSAERIRSLDPLDIDRLEQNIAFRELNIQAAKGIGMTILDREVQFTAPDDVMSSIVEKLKTTGHPLGFVVEQRNPESRGQAFGSESFYLPSKHVKEFQEFLVDNGAQPTALVAFEPSIRGANENFNRHRPNQSNELSTSGLSR